MLLTTLLAPGCGKKQEPPKAEERPAVAVETAEATAGEVVEGLEVVGTLAAKFEAEVKSEISGRVAEVSVSEWARVVVRGGFNLKDGDRLSVAGAGA